MTKYVCEECGFDNVDVRQWVNINKNEVDWNLGDDLEERDCWCHVCNEHNMVIPEDEYLEGKNETDENS